ncbi:hypothetical protein BH09PSE3_BH09PSE3_26680 [soil metagenome]
MIREAAVVGHHEPRRGARPVLVVVPEPGARFTYADMVALYEGKVARWSIPDSVIERPELPHTATGKVLKSDLREMVAAFPTA